MTNCNDLDWDALLQSTASEAFEADYNGISLGDLAQGIARTSSLEPTGLLRGDSSIPDQFRDVNLGDVLNSFANASPNKPQQLQKQKQQKQQHAGSRGASDVAHTGVQALSVAQMVDSWVRDHAGQAGEKLHVGPPVVISGVPLGAGVPSSTVPQLASEPAKKRARVGGRQA